MERDGPTVAKPKLDYTTDTNHSAALEQQAGALHDTRGAGFDDSEVEEQDDSDNRVAEPLGEVDEEETERLWNEMGVYSGGEE